MQGLHWGLVAGLGIIALLAVDTIWESAPVGSGDAPRRYRLDAGQLNMITRAMDAEGYNCPRAKDVANCGGRGDDRLLRVWCGPDDGSGDVSTRMVYKVTFQNDYATVRKWSGDPEECP